MPVQFGLSQAIYEHASNVLSKYFGPKINNFPIHEQTSPLNHPLPRRLRCPATTFLPQIGDWALPLRRHKLLSYGHLTLRNILEQI